ncbi:hypothetical protein KKF03_01640 [Patescibacteria group bacterium]|nr:hypothetical protein [Patescibacteria group bacterium]
MIVQGVMVWRSLSAQLFVDPLIYIDISPRENLQVDAGKSITFKVDGVYTSAVMPIEANWYKVMNGVAEQLTGCDLVDTCEVSVGNQGGEMKVQARVQVDQLLIDEVSVSVVGSVIQDDSTHEAAPTQQLENAEQDAPAVTTTTATQPMVIAPVVRRQQVRREAMRRQAVSNAPLVKSFIKRMRSRRWLR